MKIRGQQVHSIKDRIDRNSVPVTESGCWLWTGALKGKSLVKGYGNMTIGSRKDGTRRTISAHRACYIAYYGDINNGLFVCHSCDTPSCVNPNHLFLGTHQDNVDDREMKGRNNLSGIGKKHENHPSAKLNWGQIIKIRLSYEKLGFTQQVIADDFNVSRSAIKDIVNYKTWTPNPNE